MSSHFTYKFRVEYSCIKCVKATERLLKNLDYVSHYQTNLNKKTVKLTCNKYIDPQVLKQQLESIKPTKLIAVPSPYVDNYREIDIEFSRVKDEGEVKRYLGTLSGLETVHYDLLNHRFRIILKPNEKISYNDIRSRLENSYLKNDIKDIKQIDGQDKIIHLSITGLRSEQDAEKIDALLAEKDAYIKSRVVNYSTQSALIIVNVEKDKLPAFIKMLNVHLKTKSSANDRFVIHHIEPTIENDNTPSITDKVFFKRAFFNMLYVLGFVFFGAYIPLPLTLAGQFFGLCLGGLTLGMMWKTGENYYHEAWSEFVKKRKFNMYSLIALGTGIAFFYSMTLVVFPGLFLVAMLNYKFMAVGMILGIINLGQAIKIRLHERTRKMTQSLAEIYAQNQPQIAKKIRINPNRVDTQIGIENARNSYREISYKEVKEGDILLIEAGERFPVEGVVIEGETFVEQSALTGESKLIAKKSGDPVFSGSYNDKNSVLIRATCDGTKGHLTRVMRDVAKSESSIPSILELMDKIANVFVPTIITIAALSALGWFLLGPIPQFPWMLDSAMSVLLCACPCALLLSGISVSTGTYAMLKHKILVRDGAVIEPLAKAKKIVYDKTGTFTTPCVEELFISDQRYSKERVMQLAASLEKEFLIENKGHPLARALTEKNLLRPFLKCHSALKGTQGVSGVVIENDIAYQIDVGSLSHMKEKNVRVLSKYNKKSEEFLKKGMTVNYISVNKKCVGVVGLKHNLREDAKKSVEELTRMGLDVYLLTGDAEEPALDIAQKLGIPKMRVSYGKNKEEKKKYVELLKQQGGGVIVIGDELNDIPALSVADVSVAVGSWTNAMGNSKVALQSLNIGAAIIIARETMRNIHQNLLCTGFYNILSLAAATGVLYPFFGFVLNPVIASISMMCSSWIVMLNSIRLVFELKHKLALHEGRIARPVTWIEKIKSFLSLKTYIQTLQLLLNITQDEPKNVLPNRQLKPTFLPQAEKLSSPKLPTYAFKRTKLSNKVNDVSNKPSQRSRAAAGAA